MRKNKTAYLMLFISLFGFMFFYIIPFLISVFYAFIDNPLSKNFVGLNNYRELFSNKYFLRGLKNTVVFMSISIPLNIIISLGLAMVLNKIKLFSRYLSLIFLIPLAIPSATTAFFWKQVFSLNGVLNKFLYTLNFESIDWLNSGYSMYIIVFIFLWKNIGYNMILFIAGLNNIPKLYYECAEIEGASRFQQFRIVTLTYLLPTFMLSLIMTFINSFKVFKEIFILTGDNPHENIYVLQHYMNSMFMSLNYPKLVSSISILITAITIFITVLYVFEGRISKNLSE
ncbi:carbohydrate ABC transporter permease [Tissierellaceae bacterium HCP3S3_D8]